MPTDLPAAGPGPSIYQFVRTHLGPDGRLDDAGRELPDEPLVGSGELRWAPGAMDGVMGHHTGPGEAAAQVDRAADLFATACRQPSTGHLEALHETLSGGDVLRLVDPLLERLAERRLERAAAHRLGRWLATNGTRRSVVKVGIAVLGATGLGTDLEVVRTLGAHEEFTLYAAVALANGLPEPEPELWVLAKVVDGWGRIHCVERLRDTTDPAIRNWILREGYRNSVMNEYLAFLAATTGGLLGALRQDEVDRELLTAAGEIIEALVAGGPAEDLDDYEAGAEVVEAFLEHMTSRAETLGDFHAIAAVGSYLALEDGWEARSQRGWTATRREAFEDRCDELLQRREWDDRIAVGLLSDDRQEFWQAEQAARLRGIDTFELHLARIRDDPIEGPWWHAWQQADPARAEQLVAAARTLLPLDHISTGPADELGMGPEWRPHQALDWTLQELRNHVGVGDDLVLVGLRSSVTRNRNMALHALQAWPAPAWPDGARELAERLARADPNARTRDLAAEVVTNAG
jgi:hypothetical protein